MKRAAQLDRLLVYGYDPVLLETRRSILKMAGFTICTVASPRTLADTLTSTVEPYSLLVACHSVPVEERQALVALAAQRHLPLLQIERLITPQDLITEVSRLLNNPDH